MSDKKTKDQNNKSETNEKNEKVVTRYDLKMQRRREQKKKEEREKKIARAAGILIVIAAVCFVLSFPIRSWLTVHGTYVILDGEKVSRVEYDYNYYTLLNNYMSANSYMLSYMGLDLSGDLSKQMYSDTLTWKDYFDQQTVENMLTAIAIRREMEAEGFDYDGTEEYEYYQNVLEQSAKEEGISTAEYIRNLYGPYATGKRVEGYVKDSQKISAYLEHVADVKAPSDDDIQKYYEENSNDYDHLDYHLLTVYAELPTEPTELADPVEESDQETSGESETYQPSQAEIDAAMEKANAKAEELKSEIMVQGEAYVNTSRANTNYYVVDWLFDPERKKGDVTVIENTYGNCYYVVSFEDRYIDPDNTVNIRLIMADSGKGQAILDEWKSGDATEESFALIADKYNDPVNFSVKGGLIEDLEIGELDAKISGWLGAEERVCGDAAVISPEGSSVDYVFYFVGAGDPVWKTSIRETLRTQAKEDFIDGLTEGMTVEDPHHNLNYLSVQAQQEAQSPQPSGADDTEEAQSPQPSGADDTDESQSPQPSGTDEADESQQ